MRTIIITVGTSLLTNRDEEENAIPRPWKGWRRGTGLPDAGQAMDYLKAEQARIACAETNTLEKLPLEERDTLVWLHTDTEEGQWCADALSRFYEREGYANDLYVIGNMNYHARSFAERGLRSLLDVAFNVIHKAKARQEQIVVCATGGFKAEIAFLNLVGLLMKLPVCYIHDQFRELVWLPALPIDWNLEQAEEWEDFLRWIDGEPRAMQEAENWLKARPALRVLVSEAEDGCAYLTAAGDLLYRAYQEKAGKEPRVIWPAESGLNPNEKNKLEMRTAHHRPKGWESFIARLGRETWVRAFYYDGSGPQQPGKTRVYRRDGGKGTLGLVYCADEKWLPILVETTAKGTAQLDLVADWLDREGKAW